MPYGISNNGNVSDHVSKQNKGAYASNNICFSIMTFLRT